MARVVVLGSSNTDMTVRLPRLPFPGETLMGGSFQTGPGGKGANQAVAARRAGADVVFLTAVGDDPLGRQALDRYRAEGIDVSHARVFPDAPSGVALIFVSEEGENMIGVAPGANAQLDADAIDRLPDRLFTAGDILLAGLEVPVETVARAVLRAHEAGMRILLNPAPADRRILDPKILPLIDVLTPNRGELRELTGVSALSLDESELVASAALREQGVQTVIVTLGAEGCLIVDQSTQSLLGRKIRAYPTVAVDTVGAGDAFNGALAAALAEGRALDEAAVWACAAAALTVTRPGAQDAMPYREAIDRLANEYPAD